jgi:hypothetical protein
LSTRPVFPDTPGSVYPRLLRTSPRVLPPAQGVCCEIRRIGLNFNSLALTHDVYSLAGELERLTILRAARISYAGGPVIFLAPSEFIKAAIGMTDLFFEKPILNSPYAYPIRHWELDGQGQPTQQITETRRRADFITPIPKPRRRRGKDAGQQQALVFDEGKGLSTHAQQYDPTPSPPGRALTSAPRAATAKATPKGPARRSAPPSSSGRNLAPSLARTWWPPPAKPPTPSSTC